MAKLGKASEFTSKSAAKKAKRTAAKSKQDLEKEFASEVPKTSQLDLVVLDASPAQIPKMPKVVPVSGLDLPSPTALETQGRSCEPPDTGIIPSRSFAPPPLQDSARDALSVPTIRSRINYNMIPIEYAYLVDGEDCSSEDELRSHAELRAENRRQRRRLGRK